MALADPSRQRRLQGVAARGDGDNAPGPVAVTRAVRDVRIASDTNDPVALERALLTLAGVAFAWSERIGAIRAADEARAQNRARAAETRSGYLPT